jgi:hypothetical protein
MTYNREGNTPSFQISNYPNEEIMKKISCIMLALAILLTSCSVKPIPEEPKPDPETQYSVTLKRDVLIMMLAYPEFIIGVELKESKPYLIMKSGLNILYDDKAIKTPEEKFANADIEDMLSQIYPLSDAVGIMDKDFDPGRYRNYAFFNAVYGNTKEKTYANTVKVAYGTQSIRFTKINHADLAFKAAADRVFDLAKSDDHLLAYLSPSSGTYNYRVISGTQILSMHSYGIALDMHYHAQDYWQWADPKKAEERIINYPTSIVRAYEDNLFIWGGKWNHFDTVHYEYRPEIILKARYFSNPIDLGQPWYTGIDATDSAIKALIDQINLSLKNLKP